MSDRSLPRAFAIGALSACLALCAESHPVQIPVEIIHENGTLSGHLSVSISGTTDKAKTEWSASIRNTSSQKLLRAVLCVKAFDADARQIKPGRTIGSPMQY